MTYLPEELFRENNTLRARITELEADNARLDADNAGWVAMSFKNAAAVRAAVLAEREACATIAEEQEMLVNHICDMPRNIAAAIRARPAP